LVEIRRHDEGPKPILVVDDSATVRREITKALTEAGFVTLEAADGRSGLELARQQQVALIILDVNMPYLNGLQMLEQLRLDWATANIPVVILTTEAEELMVERARKAGAKGWLIKPVTSQHVVQVAQAITQPARPRQPEL